MSRPGSFCSVRDEGVKKRAWSAEEDELLSRYVKLHGEGKWRNLAQKAGLNRSGKSCRLRWLNYLRPGIKRGDFSSDEEELILKLHRLLGNRWGLIAGRLPGRTDSEVKNYWKKILIKRVQGQGQQGSDAGPTIRKFQAEDKKDVQDFSWGKLQQIPLQGYKNVGLNIHDGESSSPSMQIYDQDDTSLISSLDVFDTNNVPLISDAFNFHYSHNLQENYDDHKGSDELENGDQKPDLVPLGLQHMERTLISSLDVFDTNNLPLISDAFNFHYSHDVQENYDDHKGSDELENGDQEPDLVPLGLQHMERTLISSLDVFDTNNLPLISDAFNFHYSHDVQESYDDHKGSDELENGDQKPDLVPLGLQHTEMRKIARLLDIENELRELL